MCVFFPMMRYELDNSCNLLKIRLEWQSLKKFLFGIFGYSLITTILLARWLLSRQLRWQMRSRHSRSRKRWRRNAYISRRGQVETKGEQSKGPKSGLSKYLGQFFYFQFHILLSFKWTYRLFKIFIFWPQSQIKSNDHSNPSKTQL